VSLYEIFEIINSIIIIGPSYKRLITAKIITKETKVIIIKDVP